MSIRVFKGKEGKSQNIIICSGSLKIIYASFILPGNLLLIFFISLHAHWIMCSEGMLKDNLMKFN